MKISSQLIFLVIIPIIVFVSIFPVAFSIIVSDQLIETRKNEVISIIKLASDEMKNPVYFSDVDALSEITDNLKMNYPIKSIYILSTDGKIITDGTSSNPLFNQIPDDEFIKNSINSTQIHILVLGNTIQASSPIIISEKIGILYIEFLIDDIDTIFTNSMVTMGIAIIIAVIISFSFASYSSRSISKPILKLRKSADDIANEKTIKNIDVSEPDELKALADDLNSMVVKLNKSKEELIKSERLSSIGELSSRISHDLRNPLSVLSNAIAIMKEKEKETVSETTKKYLDLMQDQIDTMNHTIKQILFFVKTHELKLESAQVHDIVSKVIDEKQIPKNIDISVDSKDEITCDVSQMKTVFHNLISNAIEAIGENTGKIKINSEKSDTHIVIDITNNGPIIPEQKLKQIFEPLYSTKSEGTGLGLVSCKIIVEQHRGKIEAFVTESNEMRFRIILPRNI